jgi:hypothetical protein
MLKAQARLALLRRLLLPALAFVAGGVGHGVGLVEDDDAVEAAAEPVDDLLHAARLLAARLGAQGGVGGEEDAFLERDRGAVNSSCPAAFALILLGIGFAALGFRAAGEAKAGIIEAGELALDGVGDAFGGDRGVNVREVISAQLRARLRLRDGGHGTGSPRASDRASPARRSLSVSGFTRSSAFLSLCPPCRCERAGCARSAARCMGAAAE